MRTSNSTNNNPLTIPLVDMNPSPISSAVPVAPVDSARSFNNDSYSQEFEPTGSQRLPTQDLSQSLTDQPTLSRRNWFTFVIHQYRSIPRYYRVMLTLSLLLITAQLIAIVGVLSTSPFYVCQSLFHFYLFSNAFKLVVYIPLVGIYYLHPDGRNPRLSSSVLMSSVNRSRSVLDFFGTILFLVGNYLVFSTETCAPNSLAVYRLTLALVIIGYLKIIVPILLCTLILCLPCVLIVLRALRIGEVLDTGANEESIAKLNIVKYHKANKEPENLETTPTKNSTEVTYFHEPKNTTRPNLITRVLLKLFKRGKSKGKSKAREIEERASNVKGVINLSDEDALCCICLEEYDDGENLREMRCLHYFHVNCIDEWLKLNRTCPLCKRDIEYNENNSDAST